MIEELLPPGVVAVEARSDPLDAVLFPEEEAELAQAVEKRRLEFTTVRHCARTALARLGIAPVAILPGDRGAPQWPAGIVGSMTHCTGYRAAVVARSSQLATIGVDAEPHEALPPEVLTTVTVAEERERLKRLAADRPAVHWDRLLFSAKESVYKAWFPLTGRWLDFEEASIDFEAESHRAEAHRAEARGAGSGESGSFYARLLVPGPVVNGITLLGFAGRWLVRDGLLFTAIAVSANGSSAERTIVL
ncbi:4'-phosphopantetheinyl transferase family protein [Actinocrinis sp.]|uniref:4'-phosphopantetheinyl transferase family protein n=1 Tax=Actinocrinis sp. TaxID=1920516 RepID=UPI002D26B483|nr:4'-phosphopantetheinyl transferase superfamily protein [Actinocrinis sp.]HZP53587.1 4'-phosphopantetheinyl transferase superfamily protein [Actinocrinis sp.]